MEVYPLFSFSVLGVDRSRVCCVQGDEAKQGIEFRQRNKYAKNPNGDIVRALYDQFQFKINADKCE